jgi:hypothetical protein
MSRSTLDVDAVRADEDRLTPYVRYCPLDPRPKTRVRARTTYQVIDDTPEVTSLPDRDLEAAPGGASRGNLSVVDTVCDRGTPRLQSWKDVSSDSTSQMGSAQSTTRAQVVREE